MSPHIRFGPEPVLAAHARSPPAAGSHRLAGADSAPHSEQNFHIRERSEDRVVGEPEELMEESNIVLVSDCWSSNDQRFFPFPVK